MNINYSLLTKVKHYHTIADMNEHMKKRTAQTLKVLNNCKKTVYPNNYEIQHYKNR